MRSIPVSDGISWVGAIDWGLRDFHGYETPKGTTYNAYLVQGSDKVALVDTVKTPFVPEMLERIATVIDPAKIDLIVVNHVEPDHNSGLRLAMAAIPNARVVASQSGVKGVAEYHDGLAVDAVGPDDVIDLGGKTLRFLPMPMVHWPDSMFTYCAESATLMPNDAFGQHVASAGRFAEDIGVDMAIYQLGVYFANILMPVHTQVAKAVEKLVATGWTLDVVAPSHGVIWRGDAFAAALEAYGRWTSNALEDAVVVAYATMWGSTDTLARAVADGVAQEGVGVSLYDLKVSLTADVTYDLLTAKGLLIGSPTLHKGMLFPVAGYLQWLAGLKPVDRLAAAFGSYGWSSGAVQQVEARLTEIGFTIAQDAYTQKYRPTDAEIDSAIEWGRAFARAVKAAE
jgi:anaerobic nitric oxide reductase flavorubredoxin